MGDADRFEAAGQTLIQARLHAQRSRAQDDHVQRAIPSPVGVPQTLDGFGPLGDFLDLVENQDEAAGSFRIETGLLPVPDQPIRISDMSQSGTRSRPVITDSGARIFRLVDCQVAAAGRADLLQCLEHDGGLAGLARTEQRNETMGWLGQPLAENAHLGPLKRFHESILLY